uniref:Uncharacterized protein n=1 Tax=Siphoviridae sp. ctf8W5 TaxID=2825595 RepID=A0A8S5Q6H7_9CAUD|nr:MAG TPA: hypothetical protein [Siphoviridae sp. ctf8W5]
MPSARGNTAAGIRKRLIKTNGKKISSYIRRVK